MNEIVAVEEVIVDEQPVQAPKPKAIKKPKAKAKVKAKPAKKAAAKPKAAKKSKIQLDQFGLRKGSARSQAAAMYARKNGATLAEVEEKIGSIQLNVLKDLEAEGWKIEVEKEKRKNSRPANRYWLKPAK
jgi:hypothetical protein